MEPGARHGLTGTTTAVKVAAAIVTPLVGTLAILGGMGSFATIRHLASPWFGALAWIVPVGVDLGILALLIWDLLATYLGLPWPPLRWTAWAFIAASVYLNVTAADGNVDAAIMHAAMPALFITVIEGIRHLISQAAGLSAGSRIERVPFARWILAPGSTFLLWRHMVLWHVTSYRDGLALEHQRLAAVARLQQAHGHYLWRWRAPLGERLALGAASAGLENTLPRIEAQAGLSARDQRLVETATAVIRKAEQDGHHLSQAALARQMRARGQSVANERLRWLMNAAGAGPPGEAPRTDTWGKQHVRH